MEVFTELKKFREELDLTQAEFAPFMGFNQQPPYSRLENGTHAPTAQQITHLNTLKFVYACGLWGSLTKHLDLD